MTHQIRFPRMLEGAVADGLRQSAGGDTLSEVLSDVFGREPGLRKHLIDESGSLRPHVAVFVNGSRAGLETPTPPASDIQVLGAVSGG